MHTYTMFWIKKDFFYHYYYKSDILHRFLIECLHKAHNHDLQAQFEYVTNPLSITHLVNHIKKYHKSLNLQQEGEALTITKNGQSISVDVIRRHLTINCQTVQEADYLLFQPLITLDRNFFIIEKDSTNNGWIAPVQKENAR